MTHPTGILVFGASAFLLSIIARMTTPDLGLALRLALTAMLAQAASGVINDISDIDLDSVAKPWRALPAGIVSVREAKMLAAAFFVLAVLTSALVSAASCVLLILGVVTSALYSAVLKRTRFSWLVYVVAYPSFPVWIWISAGAFRPTILLVYLVGAPLVVAIHLVHQLRDYDEDERLGMRGFVHTLGKPKAIAACFALMAIGPVPILLTRLRLPNAVHLWLLWGAALVHWSLVAPPMMRFGRSREIADLRRIFRAIQLSAPLLMTAWLLPV
jgi:4-hydroxybenzoate polyprenyltransferase